MWGASPINIGGQLRWVCMNANRLTASGVSTPEFDITALAGTNNTYTIQFYSQHVVEYSGGFRLLLEDDSGLSIMTNAERISIAVWGTETVMTNMKDFGPFYSWRFTCDGTTGKLYKNNVEMDSQPLTEDLDKDDFDFGSNNTPGNATNMQWAELEIFDTVETAPMPLAVPYNHTWGSGVEALQETDGTSGDSSYFTFNVAGKRWDCLYPNTAGGVGWGALIFNREVGTVESFHLRWSMTLPSNFATNSNFADILTIADGYNHNSGRHDPTSTYTIFSIWYTWNSTTDEGSPATIRINDTDYALTGFPTWDQPHGDTHEMVLKCTPSFTSFEMDGYLITLPAISDLTNLRRLSIGLDNGIHPNGETIEYKIHRFRPNFHENLLRKRRLGII
jgi:hypothetical protein